jgi:starch phosphorylase
MRKVHEYTVYPHIPPRLSGLWELAYNLRWTWNSRAYDVFEHLDHVMLEKCGGNPALLLRRVSAERLEWAAEDAAFLAHLDEAVDSLHRYLDEPVWFETHHPEAKDLCFAYFCMEYGLTACLPIYSGGLGVLAGDHLKAASGLGIPLVAVGLLYSKGYFVQKLDDEGWQREEYRANDFTTLPILPVMKGETWRLQASAAASGPPVPAPLAAGRPADGEPLKVSLDIGGRTVWVRVWRVQVGRVNLFLLDTLLPENDTTAQAITGQLYGGGTEDRLAQEMVLGIGGVRALQALEAHPCAVHLNEGHAVFASLERTRSLMEAGGLTFLEARQATAAGTLFTTHTPVPAGFDLFSKTLIDHHLGPTLKELGLDTEHFMRMGRVNRDDPNEQFNVAVLALRHAPRRNAVSRLHRRVSARMMQPGWVDFPRGEMPIESVTNGVHTKSWVAAEMEQLFDHYLGPRWREDASAKEAWQEVERIPDMELWLTHSRLRERLVAHARERVWLQSRDKRTGAGRGPDHEPPLRPDALTIGFARRFATYKRANLLFRDVARLKAILTDQARPVQVILAGKAHPRDGAGKDFIRGMLEIVRREGLEDRVVFLEDYDIGKTSLLVQGVDVWLNNPRRPYEACGTSGMKVVPNGGLNLSVLDGWWAEAYRPGVGWQIGGGQEFAHADYQDEHDAECLYSLLEREIVPLFYERDWEGLPRGWVKMMKDSIRILAPAFSGDRMLKQYTERFYIPAAQQYQRLAADGFAKAKEIAAWKQHVREVWCEAKVTGVVEDLPVAAAAGGTGSGAQPGPAGAFQPGAGGIVRVAVGEHIPITARVRLPGLRPADVTVEAFYSALRPDGTLRNGRAVPLDWAGEENGEHLYRGAVPARSSGLHGYSVRVLPRHDDVLVPAELPLIVWEDG